MPQLTNVATMSMVVVMSVCSRAHINKNIYLTTERSVPYSPPASIASTVGVMTILIHTSIAKSDNDAGLNFASVNSISSALCFMSSNSMPSF